MRTKPLLGSIAWIGAWSLIGGNLLCAHDGGFGHSRRTLFVTVAGPEGWVLEYNLQQNRDEALVEMTLMDTDRDGQVSAAERDRFLLDRSRRLLEGLTLQTAAGEKIAVKLDRCELQHGLVQHFRFSLTTAARELLLDDRNFPHQPGLVHVRQGDGVTIELARPVDLNHAERVRLRIKR